MNVDSGLIGTIDAVLPQTQCTKCGYDGCKPYAAALADGTADINQCPPGGDAGIHVLAALLHRPYKPLNPVHGVEQPRLLAVIDEPICIGCTLCIQACPVDAIVGAAKQMHTVVAELCTGCDLCVPPCPVDCIAMVPVSEQEAHLDRADQWRKQHDFHLFRLERQKSEKARKPAVADTPAAASVTERPAELMAADAKKALIAAAMERARRQREAIKPQNTDGLSEANEAEIAAIEARRAEQKKHES